MIDYRKRILLCLAASLMATGAIAALVAYSFAGEAYQNERAPEVGQLNALLAAETRIGDLLKPGVEVTVPPIAPLPGVEVAVDPSGVDVTVNPACPPGGCPEPGTPEAYPTYEADPDYNADAGGGGKGSGFLSKLRKRSGGGFLSKLREREGGPLRKLLGKLFRCGR